MSIGSNIRRIRLQKRLTLEQVAVPAGTDGGNLSRIERGRQSPTLERVRAIANVLGVDMKELIADVANESATVADAATGTVAVKERFPGRVPLVPWHRIGDWKALGAGAIDQFEWIPTSASAPFGSIAAAVVPGDSMESDRTPSFPEGTMIVVEDKPAKPGDYVVAMTASGPTFKRLVDDGGVLYLKPLNVHYPISALGDASIVGVVVEAATRILF